MGKVDNSIWRCTYRILDPQDGSLTVMRECDSTMIQQDMEAHLITEHSLMLTKPMDVVAHFVLVRTAEIRGPERRGTTDDATMTMFDKGEYR